MYGPGGAVPLLPASQPAAPALVFGRVDATSPANQQFAEIKNPLTFAVDVSNWKISGSASAELKAGGASKARSSKFVATHLSVCFQAIVVFPALLHHHLKPLSEIFL